MSFNGNVDDRPPQLKFKIEAQGRDPGPWKDCLVTQTNDGYVNRIILDIDDIAPVTEESFTLRVRLKLEE